MEKQKDPEDEAMDQGSEDPQSQLRGNIHEMILDVRSIRDNFGERIVRRTLKSRGEKGKGNVTGLKDYWEIHATLVLTKEEHQKLEEINKMGSGESDGAEHLINPPV
jgi:hypothetical protein